MPSDSASSRRAAIPEACRPSPLLHLFIVLSTSAVRHSIPPPRLPPPRRTSPCHHPATGRRLPSRPIRGSGMPSTLCGTTCRRTSPFGPGRCLSSSPSMARSTRSTKALVERHLHGFHRQTSLWSVLAGIFHILGRLQRSAAVP